MRLCTVWEPERGGSLLCAVEDGAVRPVGEPCELVALLRGGEVVGGEAIACWDDLEPVAPDPRRLHLLPPVRPLEVWAAGVTYERSRDARMLESGRLDVYDHVYESARPELFLKATGDRVVGPNAQVGLRGDSAWQVPEPELALVLDSSGAVLGYTLGNDVSSRDIEGENPLYLPQAKIFAGSCALGPLVVSASEVPDPYHVVLRLRIERGGEAVFEAATSTAQLHTKLETLVDYLARENWLAPATVLLTGTGIVPEEFTLEPGDVVEVSSPGIGMLRNTCAPAAALPVPPAFR